jgi:hypothetical protein
MIYLLRFVGGVSVSTAIEARCHLDAVTARSLDVKICVLITAGDGTQPIGLLFISTLLGRKNWTGNLLMRVDPKDFT